MKSDKYKILFEQNNESLNKFLELYKKDKHKARVIFFNGNITYSIRRVVIFYHERGKFNIVHFVKTYGINKNGTLYSSQKQVSQIIYKDNKLWYRYTDKGTLKISGLNLMWLQSWNSNTQDQVKEILLEKFTWLRFIFEHNIQLSFNTIIKHKLYSLNDCLKYMYKVPLPICKLLFAKKYIYINYQERPWDQVLKMYRSYLINIENLKTDFLDSSLFADALRIARILGKKINCSWSPRRLIEEHDKWSKEITNIVLEEEELRNLSVDKLFLQFAEYSGYKLLTTNKELLAEGMRQQHCVGTYIEAVDSRRSGIFVIDKWTLELVKYARNETNPTTRQYIELKINQFQGFANKNNPPQQLYDIVDNMVIEFNKRLNKPLEEETEKDRNIFYLK